MRLFSIRNEALTVSISDMGAELQSIRDSEGVERLWQGDPSVWKGRAIILFPIAGSMKNNGYALNGQWYAMPKHGFARLEEWAVECAEEGRAVFALRKQTDGFPYRYVFRACFTLRENRLSVDYTVTNEDTQTFWYNLGGHEAFAAPGPIEAYELIFDRQETLERYRVEGGLLQRRPALLARDTNRLPLTEALFAPCAVCLRDVHSTAVTLQSRAHSRKIRVEFKGNRSLNFWRLPGAQYVCIEPWNDSGDFEDAPADITKKPNMIALPPGETVTRSHTIVVL